MVGGPPAQSPASVPSGTIIAGRYRIVRPLGEGGMGAVYEAVQLPIGRRCALKTLLPALARDPASVARFEREARAAAGLGHPNIVQVTDFLWEGGIPVLVMELLEGRSLGTVLRDEGRVTPHRAAFIASQVLLALDAAHRAAIVHRDIKPDNVFLTSISGMTDIVKVVDWGIAKLDVGAPAGAATELTTAGSMLGSPAYMSPEQARGAAIDLRTDVYGVGALLYRAIGGRLPYEATSMNALLFAIAEQTPTPLSRLTHIDPRLSELVERAMAKDPAARFQSAAEMHAALAPFAAPSPMGPSNLAASTVPPGPIFGAPAPPTLGAAALTGAPPTHGPTAGAPPTHGPMATTGAPPTHGPIAATSTPPTLGSPGAQGPAVTPMTPAPRSSSGALWAIFAVLVLIVLLLGAGGAGAAYYFTSRPDPSSALAVATVVSATPSTPSPRASTTPADVTATTPSATGAPSNSAGVVAPLDAGLRAPTTPTTPAPTAPTGPTSTIPTSPVQARDAGAPGLAGGTRADYSGCTCGEYEIESVKAGLARVAGPLNACYAKNQYDGVDHQFQGWELDADATGRVIGVRPIAGTTRCANIDACAAPILRMMNVGPSKNRAPGTVRLHLKSRRPDNP